MKKKKDLGILNEGVPSELYTRIPCRIGYNYARLQVSGEILPCCAASHLPMGQGPLAEVWFSDAYQVFRDKTNRIAEEQFHFTDPEWAFCQQCPHALLNIEAARELDAAKKK